MARLWIICVTLGLTALIQEGATQSSDETRLFESLKSQYKESFKYTRPVTDSTDNVTVGIGMTLIDIQDFDSLSGFGTFYSYDKLTWPDAHLTWDPRQYGGITQLRMPSEMIWKPDIVLYNSQDMVAERFESMVVVESNGQVLWVPRTKYHIRCYVPEDGSAEWECKFKFGSWVYSGLLLDPVLYAGVNKTDVTDFFANHHWEVVDNYAMRQNKFYDCCPEPYPNVAFYLKLNYKGPEENGAATLSVSVLSVLAAVGVALGWSQ